MSQTWIRYVILNTGMVRDMMRAEIPDDALAAIRPLIASNGIRCLPEIGLNLVVSRVGSMLYCTGKLLNGRDAFAMMVATRSRGAAPWWRELHMTGLDVYSTDPLAPPSAPWLGLALSTALAHEPRDVTLGCIGLAKACAWAWCS